MYRNFDEEIFLAPETIISGILISAATHDDLAEAESDTVPTPWHGPDAADDDEEAQLHDEADLPGRDRESMEAWSASARGANGFGGD
jgi:hypothetical protein